MATITRKIRIYVDEDNKELRKQYYDRLFQWLYICRTAANITASHFFSQDNIKDFFYFDEAIQIKLKDMVRDEDGVLHCSRENTVYQVLSQHFKGQAPMDMLSRVGQYVWKNYKAELKDYYKGERSLRNYKKSNAPIPVNKKHLMMQPADDQHNFCFELYKEPQFRIPFKTMLGRDRSNNNYIIKQVIAGEYQILDSQIKVLKDDNDKYTKWFLYLTLKIPDTRLQAKEGLKVTAELDIEIPIKAQCGKRYDNIGTKDEFLYQRLQIQKKLQSLQKSLRYASGGNGRKSKLQAIERFTEKERNYVVTKMHMYSKVLVNFAVNMRAEEIVLINQKQKEEEAKEKIFLLRNWSYHGLKQMIEYKAARVGIKLSEATASEN